MRGPWLPLGIVLLVVGAGLLFIPIVPQGGHTETVAFLSADRGWYQLSENVSGFSITGVVPVSVSWTSSALVDVDAATCSGYCDNVDQVASVMQVEVGTQGSLYLNQPNGGSIFLAWAQQTFAPASVNITFSIWTDLTIAGPLVLISGSIFLILGVVRGSKDRLEVARSASSSPAEEIPGPPPRPL